MKYEFRNEGGTIIAATDPETWHVVILEEGQGEAWEKALAEGPAPFVPEEGPDPLEVERAGLVVSRLQARAALLQAGLLDKVEKAVNGGLLSGGSADALTRLAWNESAEFRRNSPTIAAIAGLLDLAPEALDDLFRAARQIEF